MSDKRQLLLDFTAFMFTEPNRVMPVHILQRENLVDRFLSSLPNKPEDEQQGEEPKKYEHGYNCNSYFTACNNCLQEFYSKFHNQ